MPIVRATFALLVGVATAGAQSPPPGEGALRWDTTETAAGRYVVVPGQRAMVGGYADGMEVWTYPLQLLRDYRIGFRLASDSVDVDGASSLRRIATTPTAVTRFYSARGIDVTERIFTPTDRAASVIRYTVRAPGRVLITVHWTPTLNLMWPAGVGGQELRWDSTHTAYLIDEPSHRFRGVVLARGLATSHAPSQWQNSTRGAALERDFPFTLAVSPLPGDTAGVSVIFAGSSDRSTDPLVVAESLAANLSGAERAARAHYDSVHVIDIQTPDSAVNRALRWAQVTLEQAWVCNPQLGCGNVAGYGPSRGERRPQYAWFFAGDGLVATDALLREGAYARARSELAFIIRYQNSRTGMIWHEMSQSAGLLDWEHDYPYLFAHVDITFDFLDRVADYVRTTGDVAFAREHWDALALAFAYCGATVPAREDAALPLIPPGQMGRDEQDPQRDELSLSLAWVSASDAFAYLARVTGHDSLATVSDSLSTRARAAIRPSYYDATRRTWASGHLRSGAPVEGVTGGLVALLRLGLLDESARRALLDELASPPYRSAWGIRSTPTNSPFYDPDSYARGSVWAVSTADAVMAFAEGGRPATAATLWRELVPWFSLDAVGHAHEVLRGDRFAPERESVPDQTWSAAGFVSSAVRGVLGLEAEAASRSLRFAPALPADWNDVRVRNIALGGSDVALALHRSPELIQLDVENPGAEMKLEVRLRLPEHASVRAVSVTPGVMLKGAERDGVYEAKLVCPPGKIVQLTLRLGAA